MTHDPTSTVAVMTGRSPKDTLRSGTEPPAGHKPRVAPGWQAVLLAALAAVALTLGTWGLLSVDPRRIGGAGLIGVLPPIYFFALALSLGGFLASLSLPRIYPALQTWQILVTVFILHGADPLIHGLPRLEASYRHLGIADTISQSGQLNPALDAYFNWPGFFDLLGMLSGSTGAKDLAGLATWAPVGINVLLLAPLLALAARLTAHRRHAWTAVWLFYLTSWVGQDYLAPQAYAFILLVTLLACILSSFTGWAWRTDQNRLTTALARIVRKLDPSMPPHGLPGPPRAESAVLVVVCAVLLLAMTASHQLTPFAAIPILAAFLLTGRLRLRFLPVLAVMLPVGWLVFAASTYLQGHYEQLFGSFGNIGANAFGSLGSRVSGSDSHQFVVYTRLAEVGVLWLLAAAGAVLGRRRGAPWLTAAAGAVAVVVLIPVQPYGGELLLRIYLFSLPFTVCLAVLPLMSDKPGSLGLPRTVALFVLGAVLSTTTIVTRYGNDIMESFTTDEVALVNRLYDLAPPGSKLIEAVHNTPWKFEHYAGYDYRALVPAEFRPGASPLTCDAANQIAGRTGAYLIVTVSQLHAAELRGSTPAGDLRNFVSTCSANPGWTRIAENDDGVVFHIQGAGNGH
ncbi:hypothetical protein QFZ65_000609 [Arthrobacter sp. B3I9]|uniref:hypothetical protein n=1 Tax=Arthrobacter sp. B3I9 TaxID=3042270 RepID=UPI00278EF2AA|nr:hypothetical protein [Arthrobacter sp. B3I9]MDQ0848671.1 hypothetical protein [Arthrobacter sp. B3I9]